MNRLSSIAIIVVALACAALVGAGAGAGSGAGEVKFAEGPALLEARSGACAALLGDGRVLVTGGEGPYGVLATAEILGAGPETAPPMAFARAGHVCVALADGTVLVAGGRAAGGGETNAAEIFDPAADAWRIIAPMTAARYGATASLLADGRVLIAGGEAYGLALATLEIYDPATGRFEPVPGAMSTPRKEHAAAVLADGRVLIAGGSNGQAALDTVEAFDPATGEIALIGAMSAARAGLSATTLLGGRVLLAGGNNGETDLATTEIYDPAAGRFLAAAEMPAARRGQIAVRLPDNNQVLILGGTSGGRLLADAVLYVPWRDVFEPAGKLLEARTAAAVTSLSGKVIVAGGRTPAAAATWTRETLTYPTIRTTDAAGVTQSDFSPGETVYIRGENWTPDITVNVKVHYVTIEADGRIIYGDLRWEKNLNVQADGNVSSAPLPLADQLVMTSADLGKTFAVTATGSPSNRQAQVWTFTDAASLTYSPSTTQSFTLAPGASASFTQTVTGPSASGNYTATLKVTGIPAGWVTSSKPSLSFPATGGVDSWTITITPPLGTAAGTYTGNVKANPQTSGVGEGSGTPVQITVTGCTPPSITSQPSDQTVVVGQSASFSVIASGTTPLSYKWYKNGNLISGATSSSYTIASVTVSDAGSYHVVVSNACGSATSNAATLTVNKRSTTTAVSLSTSPLNEGQSTTVTVTVTDIDTGTKQAPAGTVTLSSNAPAGTYSFSSTSCMLAGSGPSTTCSVTYTALDNAGSPHTITASYPGSAVHQASTGSANLTVNNVPPTVNTPTVSPSPSNEGSAVTASATFTDPGTADTFTCTVNYGDGSGDKTGTVSNGTCTGPSHTYADNGNYTVTVKVTDDDGGQGSNSTSHTVQNVPPTVNTPTVSPSPSNEGSAVTASATFTDPGTADTFTCTVNYGDGSGDKTGTVSNGTCTGPSHTYGDNGNYTVTVKVTDDDGGQGSNSTSHTVQNVPPTVNTPTVSPSPSDEGSAVTASATFTDPGANDGPFTCTVNYGDGSGEKAGTVSNGTCTGPSHTYADNGNYTVTVKVKDKDGGEGSNSTTHVVNNVAPTATLSNSGPVNEGSPVTITFSNPSDPSTADTAAGFRYAFACNGNGLPTTYADAGASSTSTCTFNDNGSFTVTGRIFDKDNGYRDYTTQVIVNNVAPTITESSLTPGTVSEGGTVTLTVTFTDPGADSHTLVVDWGDGTTGTIPLTLGARTAIVTHTYLDDDPKTGTPSDTLNVSFKVVDDDGGQSNSAGAPVYVVNVAPTLSGTLTGPTSPQPKGATVTVTASGATFTDPGTGATETFKCIVRWDDGTPDTVNAPTTRDCSGSYTHTYNQAGVYTVELWVEDDDTGKSNAIKFEFIVVYDPNAGFVTGGGWINSPAGAYPADPDLTGKASFGFVSKYQKGAKTPTGNTEFQFHVAKFNFRSTSYEWLVVSGAKAQFKGTGTVNGQPGYGFLLTATDGQLPGGGGVDKFRIKIWDSNGIVYDNKLDADDKADPQEIAGGSIVIHSK